MKESFTAIIKQSNNWWIGWIHQSARGEPSCLMGDSSESIILGRRFRQCFCIGGIREVSNMGGDIGDLDRVNGPFHGIGVHDGSMPERIGVRCFLIAA